MAVVLGVEPWGSFYPDLVEIMQDHWNEVKALPGLPLDIWVEGFEQAETLGQLLIITLRDNRRLVGYWVGFVRRHYHYALLTAYTDAHYIRPQYRGHARRLYGFLHRKLRALGVQRVYNGAKNEHVNSAHKFFLAMGYQCEGTSLFKTL